MSSGQHKHRGGALNSRPPQKLRRRMAASSARASEAEPREPGESAPEEVLDLPGPSSNPALINVTLDDSDETDEEEASEEVRDVTSQSSDPEVIDLTQDDSDETEEDKSESSGCEVLRVIFKVSVVMPAGENQRERGNFGPRGQQHLDIASRRRDGPDEPRHNDVWPGTVSCPICMDFYSEIVQSGRLIVSTKCGHVFCSQCLRDSLRNANSCPTCRADTDGQYHPLYI